jgi:hypothetical protein
LLLPPSHSLHWYVYHHNIDHYTLMCWYPAKSRTIEHKTSRKQASEAALVQCPVKHQYYLIWYSWFCFDAFSTSEGWIQWSVRLTSQKGALIESSPLSIL